MDDKLFDGLLEATKEALAHFKGAKLDLRTTELPEPPEPPAGAEAIVSTAFAGRVSGRARGELLAELVSLRPSIVVAGAHGKTTTTAMIAFCLDRLGLDPTFLVGGPVPQLRANARAAPFLRALRFRRSERLSRADAHGPGAHRQDRPVQERFRTVPGRGVPYPIPRRVPGRQRDREPRGA